MERETKEISTGSYGYTVKTYATAREANAIQQALFKGSKVEMAGEVPKMTEFNTAAQFEQEQELVRQMMVSMDGDENNIVERCLDLPSGEFDDLTAQLDEIVKKK